MASGKGAGRGKRPPAPNGHRGAAVLLVLADAAAINGAFALAYYLRYRLELGGAIEWFNDVPYGEYLPWGGALSAILIAAYWLQGLYTRRRSGSWLGTMSGLASATVVGVALLSIAIFGLRPAAQSRLMLPYAAVLIVVALGAIRLVDTLLARQRLRRGVGALRTVIVGAGDMGRAVMASIVAHPGLGYRVVGFLDDDPAKQAQAIGRFTPLGGTADLVRVLREQPVDQVILTLPWRSRELIVRLVDQSEAAGAQVRIVPDLFQMSLNRVDVDSLYGIPLIAVCEPSLGRRQHRLKRAMDVVVALASLVVLSPLAAVIATAIKLDSPGPVHFRQTRLGRHGRQFTCYKFRSMFDGADAARTDLAERNEATGAIFKIRADPRLTRVGRLLRRLSLDELPQLWNVLLGDMSLVGPRPPMPDEISAYEHWHFRRLDVSPGMTGLWQVSGRSELTFDEMVLLDLFYAENWSLGLDLQILLRTLPTVLRGTGAY